jgi:hypothetical protein
VLLIDLTGLEFLGVAGLTMLLRARSEADRAGTEFVLTGRVSSSVARMLSLVAWPESTCPALFPAAVSADRPYAIDRPDSVYRTGDRPAGEPADRYHLSTCGGELPRRVCRWGVDVAGPCCCDGGVVCRPVLRSERHPAGRLHPRSRR